MAARAVCSCGWTGSYATVPRAEAMAAKHVCKAEDGVHRATRRHRCPRCGLEAVYENAGAAEARYWFNSHSCRKREEAMLRAALREEKAAAVDRTPKPCLHKYADHQHGQRATYVLDQCRCDPCSKANRDAENERTRLKAYGRYQKYVDAYPVRLHLQELKDYGIGLKRVSELSGVSNGSLTKIWYGLYSYTGQGQSAGVNGPGRLDRGPSRRVLRTTAERIYSVEAIPANLGAGQVDHERTPLARTHLQALVALGWSQSKLAQRLGMSPANLGPVIGTSVGGGPRRRDGLRVLSRGTVDAIEALYDELSMTPPPATNQRERISVSRARRYAQERGWLPPLALDEPGETPDLTLVEDVDTFDESAILRRMQGDRSVTLDTDERHELVRRLHHRGLTDQQIALETRYGVDQVNRDRRALGLRANEQPDASPVSSEHFTGRGRARRVQGVA